MRPTDLQLLTAIRNSLAKITQQDAGLSGIVTQIDIAVGELLARASGRAESVRESLLHAQALAARAAKLLEAIGQGSLSPKTPPVPQAQNNLSEIEQAYAGVRQWLVELVIPLNAAMSAGQGDEHWRIAVRQFFADLAKLEAKRAADDFIPASANTPLKSTSIDVERLRLYFSTWPGAKEPLHLVETRSLSGGFSRETFLAKLRKSSGEEITLILRKQLPGGLLGSSCLTLAGEVPYLQLAHAAGLPVAEVLWHETDTSVLGGEFIVTPCMSGVTLGNPVTAFGPVGEPLLRELASLLAKLHQIDWRGQAEVLCRNAGLPIATEITSTQAALAMCAKFETMWREASLDPLPTLELILDWLKRNPPATTRQAMLSHGDVGFHNMMGEEGHITALLDWETARLADPAKDLSMVSKFVQKYMPWDTFVAWYRDAGGAEIDEESLQYYRIFNAFTHMLVCELALGERFARAENPELEYLQLGLPYRVFFATALLSDCAPVWSFSS